MLELKLKNVSKTNNTPCQKVQKNRNNGFQDYGRSQKNTCKTTHFSMAKMRSKSRKISQKIITNHSSLINMDKVKTTTIIAIAVLVVAVASLGVTIYLNKDKFKKNETPAA